MSQKQVTVYPTTSSPKNKTQAAQVEVRDIDHENRLRSLAVGANRVLLQVSTVFPFDLFPDSIIVDENKISVIKRDFFANKRMFSTFHKDVVSVTLNTSLFFATLIIEIVGVENRPPPIKYLLKNDAIKARRLILGLAAAAKEKIDVKEIPLSELYNLTQQIGKSYEHPKIS